VLVRARIYHEAFTDDADDDAQRSLHGGQWRRRFHQRVTRLRWGLPAETVVEGTPPPPRAFHTATVVGGVMWIYGGEALDTPWGLPFR
jgi:hypothetical protein